MSDETQLVFPASIDLAGLDSDLSTAEAMVNEFASASAGSLGRMALSGPKLDLASTLMGGNALATAAPIGAALGAGILAGLGSLRSGMQSIGRTISKQLNDAFNFDKAKDDIEGVKDLYDQMLRKMTSKLDEFQHTSVHGDDEKARKFRQNISQIENDYQKFLMHSSASLKKGTFLPSIDDFFHNESKTVGKKGGSIIPGLGSIGSALNPMKSLRSEADATSHSILKIGGAAAIAFGAFTLGSKALGFLANGIKSASNLNETLSKTDVVLGSGSAKVKAYADDMAKRFGLVKGVTLDVAAGFGGIGRSLGMMGGDKLAGFSTQMTQLSADLMSFSNIDMSEAADAIRTGLSGNQSDRLKELGIVLNEATIQQYAFAHGIAKSGTELNEQQKFLARSALITQGLARVSGDLERTQGGAANQSRKLMGSITNLGTSIGTALLPAVTTGLQLLNEFASWATSTFEANKAVVQSWADSIIDGFDWVAAVFHNLPSVFEVARLKIVEGLMNISEWFGVLGPNALQVAMYIGRNWKALMYDAFNATVTGLKNLWSNFQAIGTAIGNWIADPTQGFHVDWTPIFKGFEASAEKLPAMIKPILTDLSKEIAEAGKPITDEVAARRAKRAADKNAAAPQAKDMAMADEPLKAKKDKKGKPEDKFAGALELGSKEAYSSIISAGQGRSKGLDAIEKSGNATARNTADIAQFMRNGQGKRPKPTPKLVIP